MRAALAVVAAALVLGVRLPEGGVGEPVTSAVVGATSLLLLVLALVALLALLFVAGRPAPRDACEWCGRRANPDHGCSRCGSGRKLAACRACLGMGGEHLHSWCKRDGQP